MKLHFNKPVPVARTIQTKAGQHQANLSTVLQSFRNKTAQLNATNEEEDKLLQGKFVVQRATTDEEEPIQQKSVNRTGLPDQLKSGIENLSGYNMNDVRVHYNSHKPAQLQAHAYTQGTEIHVAPGQEKHLPHEAWHVVQQMQGRVQPTMQLKGINVNDNEDLEKEADVMGELQSNFATIQLAKIGERPLDAPILKGFMSGNETIKDKGLFHQHIFFEDGSAPGDIGFHSNGLFSGETEGNYRFSIKYLTDPIMRFAVKQFGNPGPYNLLSNNCQVYVTHILTLYGKLAGYLDPPSKQKQQEMSKEGYSLMPTCDLDEFTPLL